MICYEQAKKKEKKKKVKHAEMLKMLTGVRVRWEN